jgi:hypothetical protein
MACKYLKELFSSIAEMRITATYEEKEQLYIFLDDLLRRAKTASADKVSIKAIEETHRVAGLIVSADRPDSRVH